MNRDKILSLTKRGIDQAETFHSDSTELIQEMMALLPGHLKQAGKKVLCDADAIADALKVDGLLALCREAERTQ